MQTVTVVFAILYIRLALFVDPRTRITIFYAVTRMLTTLQLIIVFTYFRFTFTQTYVYLFYALAIGLYFLFEVMISA